VRYIVGGTIFWCYTRSGKLLEMTGLGSALHHVGSVGELLQRVVARLLTVLLPLLLLLLAMATAATLEQWPVALLPLLLLLPYLRAVVWAPLRLLLLLLLRGLRGLPRWPGRLAPVLAAVRELRDFRRSWLC
jgi:hypothetical protein